MKRALKTWARGRAGALASAVPAGAAERLRHALDDAPEGSRRAGLQAQALGFVRLRGLPPEVDRFDVDGVTIEASGSAVVERLYWMGHQGWEPELAAWWPRACSLSTKVVEVGANVGYLTLLGAKANPEAHYVAVEPHPAAAKALRRNVAVNGLTNVEVVEAAVLTEKSARVELRVPPADRHAVPRSAYVDHPLRLRSWRDTVDVEAVRLQDLAAGADAILLDAEGWEWSLLDAMADDLARTHPMLFVCVSRVLAEDRRLLLELLASGYLAFAPDAGTLTALDQRELLRRLVRAPRVTRLVFATAEQLAALVQSRSRSLSRSASPAAGPRPAGEPEPEA
jgi:FkbM family methyltransferase